LNAVYARIVLALLLLAVAFQIGSGLFIEPSELYETSLR